MERDGSPSPCSLSAVSGTELSGWRRVGHIDIEARSSGFESRQIDRHPLSPIAVIAATEPQTPELRIYS